MSIDREEYQKMKNLDGTLTIGINRGTKYMTWSYDMILSGYDLIEEARVKIQEIFIDYIKRNIESYGKRPYYRYAPQYVSTGPTFGCIKILKRDREEIEKKILPIIDNKNNVVRVSRP
jgi:hypothetical protein